MPTETGLSEFRGNVSSLVLIHAEIIVERGLKYIKNGMKIGRIFVKTVNLIW
jgi:hypothetical protein